METTTQYPDDDSLNLYQFDEAFATAPAEDEEVPDGKYEVNVEKVEITRSQKGNPMLKWTLRIISGDHEGRLLWKNNVLASAENVKWLKSDLKKAGLEIERASDLPNNLDRLLDVKLLVTKKSKDEFTNIYFGKRLAEAEAAGTPF